MEKVKMQIADRLLFKLLKIERSYSQTGEDKILNHLFKCFGKTDIHYLDIGTNHPVMNNNTYLFYRQGGYGVCVEPNPELAAQIRRVRPRDVCLNVGVSANDDSVGKFFCMSSHTLSTFSKDEAEALDRDGKYRIIEVRDVPLLNINTIVEQNFSKPIDLVSIDVEGWTEEIVESFDLSASRPFCFCVETINFSESNDEKKIASILEFFDRNEYEVYADTHINTIFLDRHR